MGTLSPTAKGWFDDWLTQGEKSPVEFVCKFTLPDASVKYMSVGGYRHVTGDKKAPPRLRLPSLSISIRNPSFASERDEAGQVEFEPFAVGEINRGPVVINNEDGGYSDWADGTFKWSDTECKLQIGLRNDTSYANFETFWPFKIAAEPSFSHGRDVTNEITFPIKSAIVNLSLPAVAERFAGTGGLEGGDDLEGTRKPEAYGITRYSRVVFVDHSNNRFLGDPAGVNNFTNAFEIGNEIGPGNFTKEAVGAPRYFDTDAIPLGEVRAHIQGQKFNGGAYSAAPELIAKHLLVTRWSGAVDAGAVTAYGTDFPFTTGIYIDPAFNWSRADALRWILKPLGILYPAQDGAAFYFKVVKSPASLSSVLDLTETHIANVRTENGPPPVGRVAMGYKEHVPILNSRSGTPAVVLAQARPRSAVIKSDATTQTNYPNYLDVVVPSPLDLAADADTVAQTYLDLHKVARQFYRVQIIRKPFHAWVGDIVSIKHRDFPGLATAKKGMVTGLTLDLEPRRFEMEIWAAV